MSGIYTEFVTMLQLYKIQLTFHYRSDNKMDDPDGVRLNNKRIGVTFLEMISCVVVALFIVHK